MRRRKLLSLLLTIALVLPLTGCYDRVELEGMAFIVSLGLDKGPNNTIDVTARISVPRKLAGGPAGGGGGGGGGKEDVISGAKPITVRAHTVPEALNMINTSVERRVSMIHLANFVIGESIAREGVLEYLRPLTRYREFRRTVVIFIVPGNVRESYEANKPLLEQSVTRFTESIDDVGKHTGLIPSKKLHEFLIGIEAKNEDPIAPVIAINKKVKQENQKSDSGVIGGSTDGGGDSTDSGGSSSDSKSAKDNIEEDDPSFKPGHVPRSGGNPLEFVGTAIFKRDKLVTYLDGIETRMLLSIRGELMRTQMDFPDPIAKGKYVNVELKHARKTSIQVDLTSRPVKVKIKEKLEADLNGAQGAVDYTQPDNLHVLEKAISERIKTRQEHLVTRIFHEYQADPFTIFKRARAQFTTYQDLQKFDFRDVLKDAEVEVNADLKIRRVGVQLSPIQTH